MIDVAAAGLGPDAHRAAALPRGDVEAHRAAAHFERRDAGRDDDREAQAGEEEEPGHGRHGVSLVLPADLAVERDEPVGNQRFGLAPQAAIELPRWLLGRTWGMASDSLKLEARFPASTFDRLRATGHEVESLGDWDESVGHAGALVRQPNGLLMGGFDPRSNGSVAAF